MKIIYVLILLLPIVAYAGQPVSGSTPPIVFKFIGYSTQTAITKDSLITKNAACQDTFPEVSPPARMSSYDELIAAMDDATFIQPGSNALLRPSSYLGVMGDYTIGVKIFDSSGLTNTGFCTSNGSQLSNHLVYSLTSGTFGSSSCLNSTSTYVVACSAPQ